MKLIPGLITAIVATLLTATALADCTPPPTNMVAWWTGDGHAREVKGNYSADFFWGNFVTGKVGQAFGFPSYGQRLTPPNPPDLVCSNGFSLEMWVRLDSLVGMGDVFFSRINTDSALTLQFAQESLGSWGSTIRILASLTTPGGINANLETGLIATNTWMHLGFACTSNGLVYLALNGTVVDSTGWTVPTVISGGSLAFGGGGASSVTLDEISIYDRFLLPAEINNIYTSGSEGKCKRPELALIATASENPAIVGTNVTWTVILTNRGVVGTSDVGLTLTLPLYAADCTSFPVFPATINYAVAKSFLIGIRAVTEELTGAGIRLGGLNDTYPSSRSVTVSASLNFFGTGTFPLVASVQSAADANPDDNTNALNLVVTGTPQVRMARYSDKVEIYWASQSDWTRLEQTLCTAPFEWEGATNTITYNSYRSTIVSNLVNAPSRLFRLHELDPYPSFPSGGGPIDPGGIGSHEPIQGSEPTP